LEHAKLGAVSEEMIIVDRENFGAVSEWKQKYDTAIEKELGVSPLAFA